MPKKRPPPSESEKTQRQRFIDAAKAAEANDSGEVFEQALRVVAKHKPKKQPKEQT